MPADVHTLLDPFTRAYAEAALWSSTDEEGAPLDATYGLGDIAPDTLNRMIADCERFQAANPLPDYRHPQYTDAELAGHDFWLTRNQHGTGFWDRELGPLGDQLTEAAHQFGEFELYEGADYTIYHF